MGKAILKQYACGHIEFTGHHYMVPNCVFQGVPLHMMGGCQQCDADGSMSRYKPMKRWFTLDFS